MQGTDPRKTTMSALPLPVRSPQCLQLHPPTNKSTSFRKSTGRMEDLISVLHPQKSSQHAIPGDQIARPDPIDGHNDRIVVQICEGLQNVNDALTSCFRGHRALEGELWLAQLASRPVWPLFLPLTGGQCHPRRYSLTPPSGFCRAVIRPNPIPSMISEGTFPVARLETISTNNIESRSFSRIGNKWSAVMPDGPAAAPHRAFSQTHQKFPWVH